MAGRTLKTPGVTETETNTPESQVDQTETNTNETGSASELVNGNALIPVEQFDALAEKHEETKEQLADVTSEFASFKNDPEAMQARILELKPELSNPNLASEMAKRPDRTKTTAAKLTDKGWLV